MLVWRFPYHLALKICSNTCFQCKCVLHAWEVSSIKVLISRNTSTAAIMKLQPVTPHTFIPFTCFSLSSDANHRAPLARYDKIESVPVFGTDSRQLVGVHTVLRVNWICVEVIARWIFGAGENLKSEYIFNCLNIGSEWALKVLLDIIRTTFFWSRTTRFKFDG